MTHAVSQAVLYNVGTTVLVLKCLLYRYKSLSLETALFWVCPTQPNSLTQPKTQYCPVWHGGLSAIRFLGRRSLLLRESCRKSPPLFFFKPCEHCHIWIGAWNCCCHTAPAWGQSSWKFISVSVWSEKWKRLPGVQTGKGLMQGVKYRVIGKAGIAKKKQGCRSSKGKMGARGPVPLPSSHCSPWLLLAEGRAGATEPNSRACTPDRAAENHVHPKTAWDVLRGAAVFHYDRCCCRSWKHHPKKENSFFVFLASSLPPASPWTRAPWRCSLGLWAPGTQRRTKERMELRMNRQMSKCHSEHRE